MTFEIDEDSTRNVIWSKSYSSWRTIAGGALMGAMIAPLLMLTGFGFNAFTATAVSVPMLAAIGSLHRKGADISLSPPPGSVTSWSSLLIRYSCKQHSLEGAKWISVVPRRKTRTSSTGASRRTEFSHHVYAIEIAFDSEKFRLIEFRDYDSARTFAEELTEICEIRLSDYVRG